MFQNTHLFHTIPQVASITGSIKHCLTAKCPLFLFPFLFVLFFFGRHRMMVGFYHHWNCEFKPRSWRGVLDTTLCDKVCQWLGTVGGFLRTPIYSTNKTDRHDIIEILLLKVALNTINQIKPFCFLVHPEYNFVLIWLFIVFYISPLTFLLCSSQYCTVHSHCNNLVFSRSDFLVDNIKPLISSFPNNSTLTGEPSLAWPQNPPVKYFLKTYKNFENLLEQYQIFSFRYIFDLYTLHNIWKWLVVYRSCTTSSIFNSIVATRFSDDRILRSQRQCRWSKQLATRPPIRPNWIILCNMNIHHTKIMVSRSVVLWFAFHWYFLCCILFKRFIQFNIFNFITSVLNKYMIDWCLTPTLAVFQLYRGINKFYY